MYVLPPPNAIAAFMDQNKPDESRRKLFEIDLALQLMDHRTMHEGNGPVRGWGTGRRRR